MKNCLATVGGIFLTLAILGWVGVGHFYCGYSLGKSYCAKAVQ